MLSSLLTSTLLSLASHFLMSKEEEKKEYGGLDDDTDMDTLTLVSEENEKLTVKKSVAVMSKLVKTMADTGISNAVSTRSNSFK